MAYNDPKFEMKPVTGLTPRTIATATNTVGAAVDTRGWKWVTVLVSIGTVGGTTTGVSTLNQTASDSGFTTAVAAISGAVHNPTALLAGAVTDVGRVNCHKLPNRYFRTVVVTAGASPSVPASVTYILSGHADSDSQTATYTFAV